MTGLTGTEVQRRLWDGNPAIAVALAAPNAISLTPDVIDGADEQIILARLDVILSSVPVPA